MSNRTNLLDNGIVDFYVYDSGEDNYSISMSADAEHIDACIHISGLSSKKMVEMAVDMIMAAMSYGKDEQSKILAGVVEIQKVLAAWDAPSEAPSR